MMKTLCFVLFGLIISKMSLAQNNLLSFDEHDHYIYYQVVDLAGVPADSIRDKTLNFLKINYPKIKLKTTPQKELIGTGKFVMYGGVSVLRHEKGEISYLITIEFKGQKYRYWLTDFVFTPYKRDRYGDFVPERGIEVPLENAQLKLDKKELENYLDETGLYCKRFGDDLKQYLISAKYPISKKDETTQKIHLDKW